MNNHSMVSSGGLKKHLLKGGIHASSARFFAMLAGFTSQILLARLLGPELLGVYFLFFGIVGVCLLFVKAGLDMTLLRLIAEANGREDWGTIKGLVKTGMLLVTISGSIVTFILWAFADHIGNNWFGSYLLAGAIGVGCFIVILLGLQAIISESFRGLHKIGRASYFQGTVSSCLFLLMVSGLWMSRSSTSLETIIILSTVSFLVSVCIAGILLMRLVFRQPARTKSVDTKILYSIATPILIMSGASFILSQSDIFILGMFENKSEVGYYGAASRLASMITFILLIMKANLSPIIAELYNNKEVDKLERILRYTATIGLLICLPIALLLIIWGDKILGLFYGVQFVEGATVLALLTIGKFLHVSTGVSGMLLLMTGYHKTIMYISIFVACLTLTGFLIVVRPYGKEGVAVVSVVTLTIQNILQIFYAKKLTGVWTIPTLQILKKKPVKV